MHHVVRILKLMARGAGPLGKHAAKLAAEGKWAELQKLRCEPGNYSDSEAYFRDAMCVDLLRKCKLPSGIDTEEEAKKSFFVSEADCARTNATIFQDFSSYEDDELDAIHAVLHEWRKEIARVLGPLPPVVTFPFSQGATLNDRGQLTTIPDKMSGQPTIYSHSRDVIVPFWTDTSWFRALASERPWASDPKSCDSNRFFTVPKDGTTDRGCCVEASLNVAAQKSVGRTIRDRLRQNLHIDLQHAQHLHRQLARLASRDGQRATVDMSRASDTIARDLCKITLPGNWFALLDSLRAKKTEIDGKRVFLEKFSSMGNGFTFELETLLFSTLAIAVAKLRGDNPEVFVYGDDVILSVRTAPDYLRYLRVFGFTPNLKKTFIQGPFRESCGGDFFDGVPVRAAFLKELPNEPQQWISLANSIRRVASADGSPPTRWGYYVCVWLCVLDAIPSDIRRLRGPASLGDLLIHDLESNWSWAKEGSHLFCYAPIQVRIDWSHWTPLVQFASCTLGVRSEGVTPRGGVSGFRKKRVPLPSPDPRLLAYGRA